MIPEDQIYNGYILRPLVKAIMADAGRASAKVEIPPKPRIRGYSHAMTVIREELPDLYPLYDLYGLRVGRSRISHERYASCLTSIPATLRE